jgi:phosphonate dehydrogenase
MSARPRVVATHSLFPDVRQRLLDVADLDENPGPSAWTYDEVVRRAADADALVTFMTDRIDAAALAACPRLRIVACALKGYDNFDVDACRSAGVALSIVPDLLTNPTAELAVGLIVALGRRVLEGHAVVASGRFEGWRPILYGRGLDGADVAILGFGKVGRAVAQRLRGFNCRLRAFDATSIDMPGVEPVSLDQALGEADVVVLALPLAPTTSRLIDAGRVGAMRPGALLVNIGRGGVVDEEAVAAALASGYLGGYAADVFAFEDWAEPTAPPAIPRALLEAPNTLFTPHLGSAVRYVRRAIEHRAVDNVIAVLDGRRAPDAI